MSVKECLSCKVMLSQNQKGIASWKFKMELFLCELAALMEREHADENMEINSLIREYVIPNAAN